MSYVVEVEREGDRTWNAYVRGLEGAHTSAGNLATLDANVREVIGLVLDLPEDAEVPEYHYVYTNVDAAFLEAAKLGEARDALEAERVELAVAAALSAQKLAGAGWSVRDISGALRMTPGRVSQLLDGAGVTRAGRGRPVKRA